LDRRTLVAGMAAVPALAFTQGAFAQQNPVTAIDIALEPDATIVQHAKDANARLLKSFPKGLALDETHHSHVSVLQQFVRTDDFDKIFAAANAIMVKEKPRHEYSRRSSITTSPIRHSASRELWSNRPTTCIGTAILKPFVKFDGTAAHVTVRGPRHLKIPSLHQKSFAIFRLYHLPRIVHSNSAEQNQDQKNDDDKP
jgi:hypothetical protein